MTQTLDRPVADLDALVASGLAPDIAIDPPPAFQAAPAKVSLLTSAVDVTGLLNQAYPGDRWIAGIGFEPEAGALNIATDFPYFWSCPTGAVQHGERQWTANSPGGVKPVTTKPANVSYTPYTAHCADPCISTFGMFGRDGHARARRLLEANLSRIIENELWTGARATMAGWPNDFFRNTPTTPNGTTLTGYVSAFCDMENAIFALDNAPGMIHCQPRVAQLWLRNGLINPSPSGRQLVSGLGTLVVPGTGYDGSGTLLLTGGTHAASWIYGTSPVVYARTPIRDQSDDEHQIVGFDLGGQPRTVRAECEVAAFWDSTVRIGIRVDHLTELS